LLVRSAHYRAMNARLALLAAPLLVAAAPAPRAPEPLPDTVRVALDTDVGTIEIDLDAKHAPITSRNFLRYVREKRFDGIVFYRVMRLPWGDPPNGLIQAGTRGDPRRNLPGVAHEPTNVTGIRHTAGAISMARWAPGTASGDFSILLSDLTGLDADPASPDPDKRAGFAAFGHVASGMDVVRRIYDAPLSPTKGEGVLKGQLLEQPIRIVRARRVALPVPAPASAPAN